MADQVKIKICGVRTPEVAQAAVEAGADYIGLVFVPGSPRFVTRDEARAVIGVLGGRVKAVGVFKGQSAGEIEAVVQAVGLWGVQVHGTWDAQFVERLRGRAVVGAAAFGSEAMSAALRCPGLHAVLIDTPDPSGLGGGTGVPFDWAALREGLDREPSGTRVVLAGGLNPGNVAEAIRVVRPWGVDVSSGVESTRGVKDLGKIKAFCKAVRG